MSGEVRNTSRDHLYTVEENRQADIAFAILTGNYRTLLEPPSSKGGVSS